MSGATIGLLAAGYLALLVLVICVMTIAKRADEAMQRAVEAADADDPLVRRFDRGTRLEQGENAPHAVT